MAPSLTVQQLAERLGVPALRVYRAVQDGEIPHFRVGRSIRFDRKKVEAWIDAGGSAAEQEPAVVT